MKQVDRNRDPNKHPRRPVIWRSEKRYIIGVALGLSGDPTTTCIIEAYGEREGPTEPILNRYDVRHLARLPADMTYPRIVDDVGMMLQRAPLRGVAELVLDQTPVGQAVGDMFRQLKAVRLTITAADDPGTMCGGYRYTVGRRNLASTLNAKRHQGELSIVQDLHDAEELAAALKDVSREEQEHSSDYVTAIQIALWRATAKKPSFARPSTPPRVLHEPPR
jgi:hypothetical protein